MLETIVYIEIRFGKDAFMSGDKYTRDEKQNGDFKVNLSAGNNKIKYYECNGNSCVFEILDDELSHKHDKYDKDPSYDSNNEKKEAFKNGRIVVKSIIDCGKQESLKGVKINLYKINGLSPILVKSEITDKDGKVIFSNIEDGSYRIIELIDKEYFEKPKYINWNEITIDCDNKKEKILIVNKLKRHISKSKHS